jgi:hypothetical protein
MDGLEDAVLGVAEFRVHNACEDEQVEDAHAVAVPP